MNTLDMEPALLQLLDGKVKLNKLLFAGAPQFQSGRYTYLGVSFLSLSP